MEIHSPGDEAYEKLEFYAGLGVPEAWIIQRDTKEPDIYLLKKKRYKNQAAASGGWMRSPSMGIEMRAVKGGKLAIRLTGDDTTREELPED